MRLRRQSEAKSQPEVSRIMWPQKRSHTAMKLGQASSTAMAPRLHRSLGVQGASSRPKLNRRWQGAVQHQGPASIPVSTVNDHEPFSVESAEVVERVNLERRRRRHRIRWHDPSTTRRLQTGCRSTTTSIHLTRRRQLFVVDRRQLSVDSPCPQPTSSGCSVVGDRPGANR